ncbi:MAG: CerR family C-terminal domain-containing protein [Planctomycetaceae bacterium]|nr:CerR family C-terminal domain-containing protein [Planctomycetaceae bacterium]
MTDPKRQSGDTREKILDVACGLFADRGYRGTTVAAICKLAQANIAAVNYHFGSKEELYRQAWRHAHEQLIALTPPDGGVPASATAAERLRGRIRAGLQRGMVGESVEMRIMRSEMANPTGLLRQVIEDAIGPLRRATQDILRELLGPRATDLDVEFCEVCVIAPWMHVMHHRRAEKHQGLAPIFREDMLETITDRFTTYALAGIREIRRDIEASGGKRGKEERRPRAGAKKS